MAEMIEIRPLGLEGVVEIVTRRFGDERGWFTETWNRARFAEHGIDHDWVQDNHARSEQRGVLRGLHFQKPPFAQTKLLRALAGRVFDVVVDIREGSPAFGRWTGVELSAEKGNQILVPAGYAHGYLTLTEGSEVAYKVDAPYSREHEAAIRYDDLAIGIDWPKVGTFILSDKDAVAPLLSETDTGFAYQ